MKEKDQVGADIYIEDAPKNVANLRQRYYTICFANSTNTMIGGPRAGALLSVPNCPFLSEAQ